MAQKSILSFFKIPVKSSVETSPSDKAESPKKGPQKIKQLIESDDEEINEPKKRTSSKDKANVTEKNGKLELGEKKNNSFESANGHVNVNSSPENIPKRKTARKQIKSKSVNKKDASKPKAKKNSSKDQKKVNNNSDKGFETTGEKPEPEAMNGSKEVVESKSPVQKISKIGPKVSHNGKDKISDNVTDEVSDNIKNSPTSKALKKVTKKSKSTTVTEKKVNVVNEKETEVAAVDDKSEEQIQMDTNDKSSDDSEIGQTKSAKSKKRKQKDIEDKKQTNSDGPSKRRKVEKNLKVDVEDKKDASADEEDMEMSVDQMELSEAAKNSKPIHSFFAPMKKESSMDTKHNKDELKKKDSRSDDDNSPKKRPQKLKRVRQLIESDDDEEVSDSKDITNSITDSDVIGKEEEEERNDSQDKTVKDEVNEKKSPKINASKKTAPKKKETTMDTKSKKAGLNKKNSMPSAVADMSFNPSKNNYHPIDDALWKKDESVPYLALAKTLEYIENISSRLKIIEILANLFRSVIILTPGDLLQTLYLCLNRLAPEYEGIELGVGETLLMKAVAQATGRTLEKIKAEVAVKGDLGLVAESSRGNQRVMFAPPKLTVVSAFNKFKEIAKMSGNSAMAKKTDKIQVLFVACRDCEAKYIIRSLSGKLRIGLAEQSVLAALARAVTLTPPGQSYPPEVIDSSSGVSAEKFKKKLDSQTLELKTVYCECPNYDIMIPVLLKEGISGLAAHCHLNPGTPLKPMLAHPTKGIDEVLRRFDNNEFTCEFKYDGERAQIHMMEDGDIKVFSRNQENNTSKYPDVIARLKKALKEETKSFILDTEAVAWDREAKQILPFQVLSTRKKKDAIESEITVHVCIMAFDLLYLNGKSLVKTPLKERRDLLHSSFTEVEDEIKFVSYKDGNSADIMQQFLDESIKGNCEGLMVKSLVVDASYEIAKRSHNWLKLKKDYLEGVGDTIDVVVIGGYHGKGKRTGTYGGFLLACYDDENEEFQSICKIGTGFKDEDLDTHSEFFKQHVIKCAKSYYRYDTSLEPDAWFEPVQVWEIKCADLSISPIHKAAIGIVDPEKGISLRFPRFLKVRDDKKTEDATTSSQIAKMYENQEQVQNQTSKDVKMEEDYY